VRLRVGPPRSADGGPILPPDERRACTAAAAALGSDAGLAAGSIRASAFTARMERQVVETGQTVIWYHLGPAAYPKYISGLGLDADWFCVLPAAADDRRSAPGHRDIRWPTASPARRRRLAEDVARTYLQPA
jgi:hypothetical protein